MIDMPTNLNRHMPFRVENCRNVGKEFRLYRGIQIWKAVSCAENAMN